MSRSTRTAPAKPAQTSAAEAVEASSATVTASDAPAAAASDAPADPAVEAKTEAPSSDESSEAPPAPPEDGPSEPPMPKAPEADPDAEELRTDGPTPSEWEAAGYDPADYPPRGYAAKADAPTVEHYKVTRFCRYFKDGVVSTWNEGQVIDSLNFNIADVKAQGLPIERCSPDDKNLKPSIGHWSV